MPVQFLLRHYALIKRQWLMREDWFWCSSTMSRQKRVSQHLFSALEIQDGVDAMDRGVAAARQNAWYFECAWEVANKVGGIYTVIRSKAGKSEKSTLFAMRFHNFCSNSYKHMASVRPSVRNPIFFVLQPYWSINQSDCQEMRDLSVYNTTIVECIFCF